MKTGNIKVNAGNSFSAKLKLIHRLADFACSSSAGVGGTAEYV